MVKRLGCEVQVMLGPIQRPMVGGDPGEASGIAERRKDAWPIAVGEGDITDSAVLTQQAQLVVADHDDPFDVNERKNLRPHVSRC